jgi:hypothetical protein
LFGADAKNNICGNGNKLRGPLFCIILEILLSAALAISSIYQVGISAKVLKPGF